MRRAIQRGSILTTLLAVLVAACITPALAQNLLRNGDFEAPVAGDAPQGWSFHDFRGDNLARGEVVQKQAAFGKQALTLQAPAFPADFTAFCLPVDVDRAETDEVFFSCFYRTEEHPQAVVTLAAYGADFAEREFSTPELHSESHPISESGSWTAYATRMAVPEGARQIVVFLRIMGKGKVSWDSVALRPVEGEIEAELTRAGDIAQMPDRRSLLCRVRNNSDRPVPLQLSMEAREEGKKRVIRQSTSCDLPPGSDRDLAITYPYAYDTPHRLRVTLTGKEPDVIYGIWLQDVPGLVTARVVQPAFRGAILSSIPSERIVVEGRINAVPELARTAQLEAMVGTGERSGDVEFLSGEGMAGPWRLTLPTTGMLTQDYVVRVTASLAGKAQQIDLPVSRVPLAQAETGYDEARRLWVNGAPIFPIAIYEVPQASDLARLSEAGFNITITPSRLISIQYANTARDAQMKVILSSDTLDGNFWEYMTQKYYGHPAMVGWSGIDLPDTKFVQYDTLSQAYRKTRSGPYPSIAEADAHHPIYLALRPNAAMAEYAKLADVVLAWSDPVPHKPLTAVAEAVRAAREATNGLKPVWAIVQSSGTRWLNELSPTPPPDDRAPSADENRAMVYLALMAGADGVIYHAWNLPAVGQRSSYQIARDEPELWAGIVETNRQLQYLEPALLDGDPEQIALPWDSPVQMASWQLGDARVVVAVNTADTTAALAFRIGAQPNEEVEVLFEDRAVIATNTGEVGDIFAPYAVHIYQVGG